MISINHLYAKQQAGEKLTMLTCYDYSSARIMNQSDIEMILVGDSAAMVMHGENSTLPIDVDTMAQHVKAVAKGAPDKFIIGDMPFLSYRKSLDENMTAVEKLMKAGAHAIKLEGVAGNEDLIKHIVESGVPVMGHLGLTPQSVNQFGGFKVQGKSSDERVRIINEAKKLESLGCFSVVLECVPDELTQELVQHIDMISIGIGAGSAVDGQVLVMQDMLGFSSQFSPKFLRRYLNTEQLFLEAFNAFAKDTREQNYPDDSEQY
ncbi:3-methyl-2-oxobutanoate hydroxymethyltransferase [Marinicella sp. S1101]|uniref:3-methyl-2-oxobutanoate hydroxymethyltransferase n=1 Tax=Marinicella marina TaxID=2996016 RepID=UPI002260E7E8|nr:3-methyl-2-oxobutanoate hydroxymethyltransferase [Marinicella marina]MCX7552688.1 3-methyl-2-oxobutanoate hydroxymethyltransferase [Marinicella marina]MDJ1139564.1 3-methyl-2-oxobutanoate hydroxymethyltransferase [Marinicella marina]